jgi:hypothetical protein
MMARISLSLAVLMTIFTPLTFVHAIEQHGIRIYDGARLDEQETKFGRETAEADIYCYRTKDNVAKVTGFYKNQSGLTFMGGDESHSLFMKEDGNQIVRVTIASPWPSAQTGKMNADTLIQIIKE